MAPALSAAPAVSRVRAGDSTGARPAARRAGHAAAAAADTARGRRPHALRRGRGGGSVARTLPLAVPPLTPIRKGSPLLGCWWFCRVCSLSPAMARAALPSRPVRADARALAPRSPPDSLRPAASTAREAASRWEPVCAAVLEERMCLCAPRRPAYIPGGGQRDAAAPIGRAARCYSPRLRLRSSGPAPASGRCPARGLWKGGSPPALVVNPAPRPWAGRTL